MKMNKFVVLICLLFISLCGYAQIAYEVTGNGLEKPSFIFGTHHLAPLKVLTENPVLQEALNNADQVVTELDMTMDSQSLQMSMLPFMLAPADSTLSKVLNQGDFEKVDKLFRELTGMSVSTMEGFRPMVVSSNISVLLMMKLIPEFIQEEQLDTYICQQGNEAGKKIIPLETAAQQAQILYASTPIKEQAEDLVELAGDPEKGIEISKRINTAYFNEDLDSLLAISLEADSDPEFMSRLLDLRNEDWLKQLPSVLAGGSTFIGVGALHLAGEKGLIVGLRKMGYSVEAIKQGVNIDF